MRRIPSALGQVASCLLLCAVAAVLLIFVPSISWTHSAQVGLPLRDQAIVAAAFAVCCGAIAFAVLSIPKLRRAVPVPSSIAELDLTGLNPLIFSLTAGVGEEFLFRAALQPFVGIWLSSALFAGAHARTAILAASTAGKRAAYISYVFAASLCLGLVYEYVGLLAVVALHTFIDLAALLCLRQLSKQSHVAAGT